MSRRRPKDLLGAAGAAVLASATHIVTETHPDAGELELTWSTWTPDEWTFTFARLSPPGRLVIHMPHHEGTIVVNELGPSDRPGAGPLSDVPLG
jgi:hypothetical protein